MALRARLSAPRPEQKDWTWHQAQWSSTPSSLLLLGDRRMEAESFLSDGYGVRLTVQNQKTGWVKLCEIAKVWQPSRLKGIIVDRVYGVPFLTATQVFDITPTPRKWLSSERTSAFSERFIEPGMILLTCSGNVGRVSAVYNVHSDTLISHDLLRISPNNSKYYGWVYAYLMSPLARSMMRSIQYGHVVKHLEVSHVNDLPIPIVRNDIMEFFLLEVEKIIFLRNKAHDLIKESETIFEDALNWNTDQYSNKYMFTTRSVSTFNKRRRLDAAHYLPETQDILECFNRSHLKINTLAELTERVWWMTRFKRIFGDNGVPYKSADELFSLNPPVSKRVMIEQAENANEYFVKAGWIMMACSGQTYGLNGSVALMTNKHEDIFFSHDLIRIIPNATKIRPGYLYMTLFHQKLGRPLVIAHAYGTSIPHLDPVDISTVPVVRLEKVLENTIADKVEQAAELRMQADNIENSLSETANNILQRYCRGETKDIIITSTK